MNFSQFYLFCNVSMKKSFFYIVLTIFVLLLFLSLVQRYIGRAEMQAQAESQALAEEVRTVYDLIYQRKTLQDTVVKLTNSASEEKTKIQETLQKMQELDLQITEELKSTRESIQNVSSELAKIGIWSKLAELWYVTGNQTEAQACIMTGLEGLKKMESSRFLVPTPEIRANFYIGYAESGLRCRDLTVYEQCLATAEEVVKGIEDSKFRGEKEKTLADLKQLAEECQEKPERVFLPILAPVKLTQDAEK